MKRFHPWFITGALLCCMFTIDMVDSLSIVIAANPHAAPGTPDEFDAETAAVIDTLRAERREIEMKLGSVRTNRKMVELGRMLFFDKLLSGNRNISCATCHHSMTASGDGLSLPIGEGGSGLGAMRNTGVKKDRVHDRVPRNATPLFNLGLVTVGEFPRMFWDGRVEVDPARPSGFHTPAGDALPHGLANALEAQAMFPVTSADEMAGQPGENPIADAAAAGRLAGPGGVWDLLARRLQANDEYVQMFIAAFKDIESADDITYAHAARAIAAFEGSFGESLDSPFDRYLLGDNGAMSRNARRGMRLFYGKAGCADCHSGVLQTDNQFYSIAMPQIGPGKGDGFDGHDDFGRERVTGDPADRYKFRAFPLRNIALTGPWGHGGAYNTLEGVIRHHLNPRRRLERYDTSQVVLPPRADLDAIDFLVHNDPARRAAISASSEIDRVALTDEEVDLIIEFLNALTDPAAYNLFQFTPTRVPSGLPVVE